MLYYYIWKSFVEKSVVARIVQNTIFQYSATRARRKQNSLCDSGRINRPAAWPRCPLVISLLSSLLQLYAPVTEERVALSVSRSVTLWYRRPKCLQLIQFRLVLVIPTIVTIIGYSVNATRHFGS